MDPPLKGNIPVRAQAIFDMCSRWQDRLAGVKRVPECYRPFDCFCPGGRSQTSLALKPFPGCFAKMQAIILDRCQNIISSPSCWFRLFTRVVWALAISQDKGCNGPTWSNSPSSCRKNVLVHSVPFSYTSLIATRQKHHNCSCPQKILEHVFFNIDVPFDLIPLFFLLWYWHTNIV